MKVQDVLLLCLFFVNRESRNWSQQKLSQTLGISVSTVNESLKRLHRVSLICIYYEVGNMAKPKEKHSINNYFSCCKFLKYTARYITTFSSDENINKLCRNIEDEKLMYLFTLVCNDLQDEDLEDIFAYG